MVDNVMVGAHARTSGGFVGPLWACRCGGISSRLRAEAMEVLARLGLEKVAEVPAAGPALLKRIELARALAARARSC